MFPMFSDRKEPKSLLGRTSSKASWDGKASSTWSWKNGFHFEKM